LTEERAIEEAALLVQNKQVWVLRVGRVGERNMTIASIVAFTRESDSVTGITKVYTSPKWRSRRCAERLVRSVCKL
jgi:predicted GNAT family acetyltransferase